MNFDAKALDVRSVASTDVHAHGMPSVVAQRELVMPGLWSRSIRVGANGGVMYERV